MITFEDALKMAKQTKPNVDNCTEYEKGWVFGCYEDSHYIGGYEHTPLVILRDGTQTIIPEVESTGLGEIIKSFDL